MRLKTKRLVLLLAGLVLSGLALAFFARRLAGHWSEVAAALGRADLAWLAVGVCILVVLYYFRVARWRLFLGHIQPVRGLSATSATCIGFMANNILPWRLGEFVRSYVLHRRERVVFGHALATVGLARVFDLIGLSILLLVTWIMMAWCSPVADAAGDLMRKVWQGGLILVLMAAAGSCVLVGLAVWPAPLLRTGEACSRLLPAAWRGPANGFLRSVAKAMGFVRGRGDVALAVGLSAGVWLAQGASTYALARALGLGIGLAGSFLAVVAVAVAVALPQAPGYLGTFHLAAALTAEAFQAGTADAGAFAMLMWLVDVVPVTLVGLGFLWYEGLSLRRLVAASSTRQGDAEVGGATDGQ